MAKAGKDGKMPDIAEAEKGEKKVIEGSVVIEEEEEKTSKGDKLYKSGKEAKHGKEGKHAKLSKHGKVDKGSKAPGHPGGGPGVKKRSKKRRQSFVVHIYKVLRQIHGEITISKKGMNIMNSFMQDIFDRIATEATKLLRTSSKKTLTSREIETAVRLMLPGQLSKHAVTEGTKAVSKFTRM